MNQEEVIKELNEKIAKLEKENLEINFALEDERLIQLKNEIKEAITENLGVDYNSELYSCVYDIMEIYEHYAFDNYGIDFTKYRNIKFGNNIGKETSNVW